MNAHIASVSRRGEPRRPQRNADVALLQAAVEAYDAEQLVEQAQFFVSAIRGWPKVRQDTSLSVHFRYLGQSCRSLVA